MSHRIPLIEEERIGIAAALYEIEQLDLRRTRLLAIIAKHHNRIAELTRSASTPSLEPVERLDDIA